MSYQIYIVEDHPIMQEMLKQTIEAEGAYAVCGIAKTAEEALDDLEDSSPSLILIDVSLPQMSGIELVAALQHRPSPPPCLVYSGHNEPMYARQAFDAGARGYLVKGEPDELPKALRQVLSGQPYLSNELREDGVTRMDGL